MGSVDPFWITVDEERHAVALAQDLIGVSDVDLQRERDRWVVSLRARQSGNLVRRVLDAVRRSLAGDPTASALVTFDGREYHLQGTCVARTAMKRDRSTIVRLRDPEGAVGRRHLRRLARGRARPLYGSKGAGGAS